MMDIEHNDIDKNDRDDPSMVTEYINDIFEYLFELEKSQRRLRVYIEDSSFRERVAVLVDWVIQVHATADLIDETLFTTVFTIYHALEEESMHELTKEDEFNTFRLIGITALFTSSKLHEKEGDHLRLNDAVILCDGVKEVTRDGVLDMEEVILDKLDFSINYVTPYDFYYRFNKAADNDYKTMKLSLYFMEMCFYDKAILINYLPSQIAIGAIYHARFKNSIEPLWHPTIEFYSHYTENDAKVVSTAIEEVLKKMARCTLRAVNDKYKD